jgi:SAM-dependent methyltransferase
MTGFTHIVQDFSVASSVTPIRGERIKYYVETDDPNVLVGKARDLLGAARYLEALDLYEQAHDSFPQHAIEILCEVFELYKILPQDRYSNYQARHFNFAISPSDKVLDIGSGHLPFPLATHLAEYAIQDSTFGRAGTPFKYVDGKPVTECSVEAMPFQDKEFDFVYCSHVLEHVESPEKACNELMRVAKSGYIETPLRGKDLFLNTGKISNHIWGIEFLHNKLIFTEYNENEVLGLQNDILLDMHVTPQTAREKSFSSLVCLKSDRVNVMMMWKKEFSFEVRRLDGSVYVRNTHQ